MRADRPVAHRAQRPAAVPLKERVLDVLGDEPGDVLRALGPLLDPPAPVGHRVLDQGDDIRVRHVARRQIGEDQGAGGVQGLLEGLYVVHALHCPPSRPTR